MSPSYQLDIVNFAATSLAGMVTRTDMQKSTNDCPALWEQFSPRMPELSAKAADQFQGASFGLSKVVDVATGLFDYYACLPYAADKTLPEGMSRIDLPASTYAKCTIASLNNLIDAYNFIYEKWLPAQKDYKSPTQGISFEHYDERYTTNGSVDVYIPLLKKA